MTSTTSTSLQFIYLSISKTSVIIATITNKKADVFKIEADDVGPLYKLRIGHDNKGASSGWLLDNIHIQRHAARHHHHKQQRPHSSSSRHSSRESLKADDIEDYYFFVNRWFAKDEDDRQIVRELTPTDAQGRPLAGLEGVVLLGFSWHYFNDF